MRTVWFHRSEYKRLYGGHLKHSHYVRHTADMAGFEPKITFTGKAGNDALERERQALWPPTDYGHADHWTPQSSDILFLAGLDWRYLFEGGFDSLPNPRINLVQGVRHAEAGTELYEYLSLKAVRICVSQEVADAILETGRVNGPVVAIANGIEALSFNFKPRCVPATIVGYKNPKLAQALAIRLSAEGVENRCLTEFIPRESFLNLLSQTQVAVCLPKIEEGFYMPPLEAMGSGCLVVTVDCIGNRGFCIDKDNCLIAGRDVDSIAKATLCALHTKRMKRWRMQRKAISIARQHSLSKERRRFHAVLCDIDQLWADAA